MSSTFQWNIWRHDCVYEFGVLFASSDAFLLQNIIQNNNTPFRSVKMPLESLQRYISAHLLTCRLLNISDASVYSTDMSVHSVSHEEIDTYLRDQPHLLPSAECRSDCGLGEWMSFGIKGFLLLRKKINLPFSLGIFMTLGALNCFLRQYFMVHPVLGQEYAVCVSCRHIFAAQNTLFFLVLWRVWHDYWEYSLLSGGVIYWKDWLHSWNVFLYWDQ